MHRVASPKPVTGAGARKSAAMASGPAVRNAPMSVSSARRATSSAGELFLEATPNRWRNECGLWKQRSAI